jgi:microcystin-dependent protein
MTLYKWSQTAASDATADPTINWQEGQAPSTVNDSARAMMAATAKYRDDISGAIVTSGSSTAYTVSSYQVFDSLVHLSGQMIAFTPHVTNAATVTLSVDSLTPRPLRTAPGVELLAGTIIQGTPYVVTYNNSDGAFYLRGFYGASPYLIPLAAGMDFWGPTAPNSSFAFPIGQAISRTTYATLFALIGGQYGSGDGSTTFNLPDKTGRVSAMQEASSSRLTSSYFGGNSTVLGAVGGLESATAPLPAHTHSNTLNENPHTHFNQYGFDGNGGAAGQAVVSGSFAQTQRTGSSVTGITIANASAGSGTGVHNNVQPTIICNYIIRII